METSRRAEIPVNIKHIMEGKANDFPLLPNDVLVIPKSHSKANILKPLALSVPGILISFIYIAFR